MRIRYYPLGFALFLSVWIISICGWAVTPGRTADLNDQEREGYEQWLHSLENSIMGREKAGRQENYPLYPFGLPRSEATETPPYRFLSISRALSEMERATAVPLAPRGRGAFAALAMARNYRNLTEYENAVAWYQRAAQKDTTRAYSNDINRESLATAVALDDSLRIVTSLVNTLGTSNLAGREGEIVISFRYLLVHRDEKNLALLVQKVSRLERTMSHRLRYWHAFAQASLQEWPGSLGQLRKLVSGGSLSHGLSEQQRIWVLTALPDMLVMLNQQRAAASLYRQLAGSELVDLRTWGEFQLASLELLTAQYLRAYLGFQRVCESNIEAVWQRQACDLAALAEQLNQIKAEGEPYGTATYYE